MLAIVLACAHVPQVVEESEPPPVPGATVRWFELEGSDRVELLESCIRNCPQTLDGTVVTSLTTWELLWTWQRPPWEPCEVASVLVDASIVVDLPYWNPPAGADTALVEEWYTYVDRLRFHEQGHADLVHSYEEEAEDRIREAGCDHAEDAARELMAEVHLVQADYDRLSENGRRQGASFWPR